MSTYSPVRREAYLESVYIRRERDNAKRAARRNKAENGKRFGK